MLEAEIRATQQIAESLASAVAHSPAEAVAINGNKLAYELETLVNAAQKGTFSPHFLFPDPSLANFHGALIHTFPL